MKVPFMDLQALHAPLRGDYLRAIEAVMDSGNFSGGPFVERFEEEFAAYCGTRHAVGVGSGTDALWLTLAAMGIGPGDEVITVPMTFAATVEAIRMAGAKPVFVDIDPVSYTMDPAAIANVLTPQTKALLPVHLFGQTADMAPILALARKHGLRVIEDAAQAHGAEYSGRKAGSLADAGCFSFFPAKNLGGFGEGGAVTTNDEGLARTLRMLRDHGQSEKYRHELCGWNSRMDGIQAAVLSLKLRDLDEGNQARERHALRYRRALAELTDVITPAAPDGGRHVYHIYAIQVRDRQKLTGFFERRQIGFGVHYPVPVHLQPAYRRLGHKPGDFPIAEQCAGHFVSLPMFPALTPEQISSVADAVKVAAVACAAA